MKGKLDLFEIVKQTCTRKGLRVNDLRYMFYGKCADGFDPRAPFEKKYFERELGKPFQLDLEYHLAGGDRKAPSVSIITPADNYRIDDLACMGFMTFCQDAPTEFSETLVAQLYDYVERAYMAPFRMIGLWFAINTGRFK